MWSFNMKRRLFISILTLFLCTSCNGGSSLLICSSTNSMSDPLMEKYQYGLVRMQDGIYKVESKVNYHYFDNRIGIVNSVALIEFNNGIVTKLNQKYEGSMFFNIDELNVLYEGNVYFDGSAKYEEEIRNMTQEGNTDIINKVVRYKYEVNELSFFDYNDSTRLCGTNLGSLEYSYPLLGGVYSKIRIDLNSNRYDVVVEGNSAKGVRKECYTYLSSIYSNEIFFDENLDYYREEITYNSVYLDAVFTFQRVDSFVYKTIENENDYTVITDPDRKQVYII